ncbi:ROK family protein [Streptomyces sp. DSM 44917]|uniref:ROK family protein n=1 Tax=Streptomyces boetiae TaxID=3075541 RepID=A0ABU2LEB1_9ACTN|nr:ROK family protein [Streptomyces sp. DSM 44917]MDT0309934.1 ROK family protein [Streptomyces sp. DSM 44917]
MTTRAGPVAALDIGGTSIAAALVDGAGAVRHRQQRPTPAAGSAADVLAAVTDALAPLTRHPLWPDAQALGIGSAGPVDSRAGTVSPVKISAWRDFPLVDAVRAAMGGLPVTLTGDGVAPAAAEDAHGAARGLDHALCPVVSTGMGGGPILDGHVHPGPTGNAGHIGHLSVDLDGPRCPCGGHGCLEGVASGPAIARRARAAGWRPGPGGDATAAGVAAAARAGDPLARAACHLAARPLPAGIAATAVLTEIRAAVIGGGVARAGDVLLAPLRQELERYAALPFARGVAVLPAGLGTDAGLVGAAAARASPRTFLARGAAGN